MPSRGLSECGSVPSSGYINTKTEKSQQDESLSKRSPDSSVNIVCALGGKNQNLCVTQFTLDAQ